jgi:hypothetical protein
VRVSARGCACALKASGCRRQGGLGSEGEADLSVHAEVHGCGCFSRVKVVDEHRVLGDLVACGVPPHNDFLAVDLSVKLVHRPVILHVHRDLREGVHPHTKTDLSVRHEAVLTASERLE